MAAMNDDLEAFIKAECANDPLYAQALEAAAEAARYLIEIPAGLLNGEHI